MAVTERPRTLLLAAAFVAVAAPSAAQDHRVAGGAFYYTDSDGLTVVHPAVNGSVAVDSATQVDVGYDADVVSAATIDVRTSASVRPFSEVRQGGSAAVTRQLTRTATVGGGYAISHSLDFQSHTIGVRGTIEDDARIHTFGVALRGAYNLVGRAGDPQYLGDLTALGATVSWTGVLASWLVADVSAALEWHHGYLESPYRYVAVRGDGLELVYVPESVPDDRIRTAISARLRAALTETLFARGSYRLHVDDWGVVGHTVELGAIVEPVDDLLIGVSGRILVQAGASFYSGDYRGSTTVPLYVTRDRELAPGWMGRGGLSGTWRFAELGPVLLSANARLELHYYRYFRTPLLRDRTAGVVGLNLIGEM